MVLQQADISSTGRPCGLALNADDWGRVSYYISLYNELRFAKFYYSGSLPGSTTGIGHDSALESASPPSPESGGKHEMIGYSGWSDSLVATGYNVGYRN
jgi:hypothetical protein